MASTDNQEHRTGCLINLNDAILSRIVSLSGDGNRIMEYLQMKSGAERQKALKDARKASGQKLVSVWLHETTLEKLRQKFEGQRGGIDWDAVVSKALD